MEFLGRVLHGYSIVLTLTKNNLKKATLHPLKRLLFSLKNKDLFKGAISF
jgi:hypothetical protein